MNNIFILYPDLFNCYEKFERKINFLIQNITDYSIIYTEDNNDFIKKLFEGSREKIKLIKVEDIKKSNINITHGIIFDDGEEFLKEKLFFTSKSIRLKIVNIKITRVINIKRETKYGNKKSTPTYEYIGRGSLWGNPYSMYEKGDDRNEVIRKYKYDFDNNMFINKKKSDVYKLLGKRLGCFCKPAKCHGDILADYLNKYDDGK